MRLNEATNWRMSLHSTSLHLPTELTQWSKSKSPTIFHF